MNWLAPCHNNLFLEHWFILCFLLFYYFDDFPNHDFLQLEKRFNDYKLMASDTHGQIKNIKRQHPD